MLRGLATALPDLNSMRAEALANSISVRDTLLSSRKSGIRFIVPPEPLPLLVNGDSIASLGKHAGRAQSRGPRADHGHLSPVPRRGLEMPNRCPWLRFITLACTAGILIGRSKVRREHAFMQK